MLKFSFPFSRAERYWYEMPASPANFSCESRKDSLICRMALPKRVFASMEALDSSSPRLHCLSTIVENEWI